MDAKDQRALAAALLPAVLEAGRIEMRYFRGGVAVERKSDASPVTAADREAEDVLVRALARAAPGVPVIAEEQVAAGAAPAIGDRFFLVDPLDGTKEFVAGRNEFTVNIGLIVNRRPVFGIVYAPARSHLFLTLGPEEAFEATIAPDEAPPALGSATLRPIRTRAPDAAGVVALQSRSHSTSGEAFLGRLKVAECRRLGSSVKFCLIARGEADVYGRIGPTCEWDTAAGHAVLAAAGGRVTNLAGADLTYGHTATAFTNPEFVAWARNPLF
ncbi:MAG: 3'(2'),5'-bisphosphate nucleotidase CysQ [Hyphomicrobium sp.]